MIGQDKIIEKINKLTLDTFPRSILLLGESGSGKKTLINEVVIPKLNLPLIDITDSISLDVIYDIYLRSEPYIYIIDMRRLSVKKENAILKLVEEPLKNSFLILIDSNKNNIIPTIVNRCQVWELEKYSKETLQYFLTTKFDNYPDYFYLTDIFNTPGQLLNITTNDNVKEILSFIDTIINNIGTANVANILNISNRIDYKNDDNKKWNYEVFCKLLIHKIQKACVETPNLKSYRLFLETKNLVNDSNIPHINKQHLFENYLYKIKYILR